MKNRETVVIAGATGFLGNLLAHHYAERGFDLVLISRNENSLNRLKFELENISTVQVTIIAVNFEGDFSGVFAAAIREKLSSINSFINTIGSQTPIGPVLQSSFEDWEKNIQVNLVVPAKLARFFGEFFVKRGSGSMILLSGGGATNARPNFSSYASAKAGIVRFVETFALELEGTQVRINAIAPGVMPSKMIEEIAENSALVAGKEEVAKAIHVMENSLWDPAPILSLCDFLISEKSKGITGKLISAEWDNWSEWPQHLEELRGSDLYTLRRITSRDRGETWGDI
jgi:3-oxoacyl-[acyl-carrier protein] reductase